MRESWRARIGWAALQIAIVAFCWWRFGLYALLPIGLIATIIVSTVVSPRWSNLVSGVGLVATAAALFFAYGATQIPGLMAIVGVIFAALGVHALRGSRRSNGGPDAVL